MLHLTPQVLESMSTAGIACMPIAGLVTYQAAENAGMASAPLIAFAALLVTGLLAPFVKWLMRRSDQERAFTERRVDQSRRREDQLQAALVEQLTAGVVAFTAAATDLRSAAADLQEMVVWLRELRAAGGDK